MSKYSEILKGDVVAKAPFNALSRKVAKQMVLVEALIEDKRRAREAAAQRTDSDLFVTRAELYEALESGEAPVAWSAYGDDDEAPEGSAE